MRMSTIAASALALLATDGAGAQRVVMHGPGVPQGAGYAAPAPHTAGFGHQNRSRWGSRVNGHWWAGENAPGGWRAYHRPVRGWTLPNYWIAPSFAINDWSTYGLGTPPAGYGWTRYYDDAVLVDGNGRVYDCVNGVDWNRGGYAYDGGEQGYDGDAQADYASGGYPAPGAGYAEPGQVQRTYGQSTYAPYPPAPYQATAGYPADGNYPPAYAERRNSGVGGALVGAAVGGVAGNVIAGRGNRLAGTLIGAGVGGAAGYAIDRSGHHRVPVAPREGYGYAPPRGYAPSPAYAPPPPPPAFAPPPPAWRSPDGGTVVTTSSVGGYGGGSTTVVTVQTAPVVTTTTTSIVEDAVTYTKVRRPARHKWVRRSCGC